MCTRRRSRSWRRTRTFASSNRRSNAPKTSVERSGSRMATRSYRATPPPLGELRLYPHLRKLCQNGRPNQALEYLQGGEPAPWCPAEGSAHHGFLPQCNNPKANHKSLHPDAVMRDSVQHRHKTVMRGVRCVLQAREQTDEQARQTGDQSCPKRKVILVKDIKKQRLNVCRAVLKQWKQPRGPETQVSGQVIRIHLLEDLRIHFEALDVDPGGQSCMETLSQPLRENLIGWHCCYRQWVPEEDTLKAIQAVTKVGPFASFLK